MDKYECIMLDLVRHKIEGKERKIRELEAKIANAENEQMRLARYIDDIHSMIEDERLRMSELKILENDFEYEVSVDDLMRELAKQM